MVAVFLCVISLPSTKAEDVPVEFRVLDLPEVGGTLKLPSHWHVLTPAQAAEAIEMVEFASPKVEAYARTLIEGLGKSTMSISKFPEPYVEGVNPTLAVSWAPMPPEFDALPAEQRSPLLAKVLSDMVAPGLKDVLGQDGFTLVEAPVAFAPGARHQGAWMTYRSPMKLKNGLSLNPTCRTFLLFGNGYVITVSMTLPSEGSSPADNALMAQILKSVDYARK